MRKRRPILSFLLALALVLGLCPPLRAGAAEIYFTGINDSVAELRSDTMPLWANGTLYVPYTVFSASTNGIGVDLGLRVRYNDRSSNTITLYNSDRVLSFDLASGTSRNDLTGEVFSYRAIMRNGRPFLPLDMVCTFFGLSWSYFSLPSVPQGHMVRIKSTGVAISDGKFPDAAGSLIDRRLREYTQTLSAGESTSPSTSIPISPSAGQEPSANSVPTYLALVCEQEEGLAAALTTLEAYGCPGLFFLSPQLIQQQGGLVRRILGTGHSIGILAQGGDLHQTQALLDQGLRALEQAACTRTALAYVPQEQCSALEREGWICWPEDHLFSPSSSTSSDAFSNSVLRRLEGRSRTAHLTLEGGSNTARVLPALLRALSRERFTILLPLETRL